MAQTMHIHLARQFTAFTLVSGLGLMLSFLILAAGIHFAHLIPFFANAAGDFCAAAFVFTCSARKIFVTRGRFLGLKFAVYLLWQAFLIMGISLFVGTASQLSPVIAGARFAHLYPAVLAKAIITPVTLLLNFLFAKFLLEQAYRLLSSFDNTG